MKKRIKTLVIGIGNEFRCDDAIGIITARKLKDKKNENFDVAENNGDGASLIDRWTGYETVILIDAVKFNNNPGRVHVIDPNNKPLPKDISLDSSHLFNIPEAIETARVLKRLPGNIIIYGIEGKRFEAGTEITGEVMKASDDVALQVLNEIRLQNKE